MDIDINFFRSLATVLAFIAFISICVWAYSSKRKDRFEEAASLPLRDTPPEGSSSKSARGDNND